MHKIFLVDSYSKNTGDIGILLALLDTLKATDARVVAIEASHPDELLWLNDPATNNIAIYPRIFDIRLLTGNKDTGFSKKIFNIICGAFDSLMFLLWACLQRLGINAAGIIRPSRRKQAKSLITADVVWSVGGGFLSSHYNYVFRLYIQLIARILGKKVVVFAQSIGPFNTRMSRLLIPNFLKRVDDLSVREPWSNDYLQKFKISPTLTNDIAFNLQTTKAKRGNTVAICIKNTSDNYDKAILSFVGYLLQHETEVILTSQTPADDHLLDTYRAMLGTEKVTYIPYGFNARDLKKIYGECKLLIASRMHAIIFGSATGVPFISLAYEPKFYGLQRALEYPNSLLIKENEISYASIVKAAELVLNDKIVTADTLLPKIAKIKDGNIKNIARILSAI